MRCWKSAGAQRCCRFRKSRDQRLENRSAAGWRRARIESTVELFRNVNIDWLGKKWYFLGFSLIFSVAGIISMAMHWAHIGSPVPLGVDFRGGTQLQVQFSQTPDVNKIRQAMDASGIRDSSIQLIRNVNQATSNDVLIS